MQLLVSVRHAAEAAAALAGGADIIDAKEPAAGPLGAVAPDTLRAIAATVGTARIVTAALGDARDEAAIERDAAAFVEGGARFVKVGFAEAGSLTRTAVLLRAAARGGGRERVIAVAYADHDVVQAPSLLDVLAVTEATGVAGILLDTANKEGPSLTGLVSATALTSWVRAARAAGLLVALAGRVLDDDIGMLRDTGADIVGVRGAVCDGGRGGLVSSERVRTLKRVVTGQTGPRVSAAFAG